MKLLFLLSLFSLGSLFICSGCNQKKVSCGPMVLPNQGDNKVLSQCELKVRLPAQMKLDGYGLFEFHIRNVGAHPVTLVAPGDGSESGWRTPTVSLSFLPVDSWKSHPAATASGPGGRCGNINKLEPQEVFQLAPGEEKKIAWGHLFGGRMKPGKYRVRMYYENIPDMKWSGLVMGGHDKGAMRRVRKSTPVSLVSNEVEVEILAATPVPSAG